MRYKGLEIAVGAFILAGMLLIIAGIFTILGEVGVGSKLSYYTLYENVSTIEHGAIVRSGGGCSRRGRPGRSRQESSGHERLRGACQP